MAALRVSSIIAVDVLGIGLAGVPAALTNATGPTDTRQSRTNPPASYAAHPQPIPPRMTAQPALSARGETRPRVLSSPSP
jgi:hypothetical protein